MSEHTAELRSRHIRGKRRIGVRGWDAVAASAELRELIVDEITPQVDRRMLPDNERIGSVTFDPERSEICNWTVNERYFKTGDK